MSFWKWKFAREARLALRRSPPGARRSTTVPPFIPIQLAPPRPPRGAEPTPVLPDRMEVEIALGPDRCLRVRGRVDPAWLVQVLRGLEGRRC